MPCQKKSQQGLQSCDHSICTPQKPFVLEAFRDYPLPKLRLFIPKLRLFGDKKSVVKSQKNKELYDQILLNLPRGWKDRLKAGFINDLSGIQKTFCGLDSMTLINCSIDQVANPKEQDSGH